MKILIPLLLCFVFMGCGGDAEEDAEIIDQTLQGTINGEDWTFMYGIATTDEKQGTVFVTMVPVAGSETSPCSIPSDYKGPKILMIRKPVVASGNMSFTENLTFSYQTEEAFNNDVATDGKWRFDSVDDDKITGAIVASTGDHQINGTFELTRCPDPFANF